MEVQVWDTSGGWSDYFDFGGTWSTFAPTAVSWGQDRIDVFLVGPVDHSLYHIYWDGSSWHPPNSFESLGGYCTSRPIAVSWASGRIDIFVRGGDAGLWHLSYSNGWSNWTSISGNTPSKLSPTRFPGVLTTLTCLRGERTLPCYTRAMTVRRTLGHQRKDLR